MYQPALPEEYAALTDDQAAKRIDSARAELGDRLLILGHHYQRDEIVRHADFVGDSYKLSKLARDKSSAPFIVFCGVHFMAESADILTPPERTVILPNLAAGCSMADMAGWFQVQSCWKQLTKIVDAETTIPITYINSAANLKAFVGERGGTCCTSSNAPKAVDWAMSRGERLLFFPDEHLGRNTGWAMGYDVDEEMVLWDPYKPLGGNTEERLASAKFILWKGHCSVHKRFTVEQIEQARKDHHDVNVLVHPECPLEVVEKADMYGSTGYIVKTVEAAEPGSKWAIGTEINLVRRLAKQHPDKDIFCLDDEICPCATMYRIHPSFLCWALENLVKGQVVNEIRVPDKVREPALLSLERMLELG